MKASAIAPSNIALSKYWGKFDDELTIPLNDSISMSLQDITTHTTVEFSSKYKQDEVWIGDSEHEVKKVSEEKEQRVIDQLERCRKLTRTTLFAKVVSTNNFPTGVGIASSASAFSALTLAVTQALSIDISKKELSILTRLAGSGSATRSIYGGFVKWKKGRTSKSSFATQIVDENYWDLCDIILIVSTQEKSHSSLQGHQASSTSPYLKARIKEMKNRNQVIEQAILRKDFQTLGEELEKDMFSLHFMAITSEPSIVYFRGPSIEILHEVRNLRDGGIPVYATLDAGPNVHLIVEKKNKKSIEKHFSHFPGVQKILFSDIGKGASITNHHLF